MNDQNWFEQWFGHDYVELYAHRDDEEAERQVDAVLSHWDPRPGNVLDLACGHGRHLRAFAARGVAAWGIDLSAVLLGKARAVPTDARLTRCDMRRLPFADGSFDSVVSFFTSVGYFADDDENAGVIREVVRLLRPGGRFAVDTFNPGPTIAGLVERDELTVDGRSVGIRRWYDADRKRVKKEIRYGDDDCYLESVRAFSAAELERLFVEVGLALDGSFEEKPDGTLAELTEESPRMLIFGRKESA